MAEVNELIDDQVERQGVSCIRVSDGHVMTFTREMLEKLLARALESGTGRVIVFVKHGAQS